MFTWKACGKFWTDLWRRLAMETSGPLNVTQMDNQLDTQTSNCCTNSTPTNTPSFVQLDDSTKLLGVQVILILAYSTIIFCGVTGNSLVIYVVYRFKNLRTVTNFFIVNLAVADLLVNTLCLPFTLVYTLYGEWMFGQILCFMLPCAQGMAVHVSTITMNIIALDRHRSIVRHTETRMSKDMCALVIVITWAASALLASPLAIFREYGNFDISPDETIQFCTEKWPGSDMNGGIYSISMLLIQYGVPLAINSFAYIRIWSKLQNHLTTGCRSDRHQRKQKTTKMLFTMVVVFAVSWLPFHAFQLAVDIDSSVLYMKDFKLLFTMFHIIAMCSTFVNPILYGWMNKNYRAAFLSVCRCNHPFSLKASHLKRRRLPKDKDMPCTVWRSTNL
ncbi:neuropeptide Y receptor type 2 [Boleophthalmus pectinirostris]|uniref:neuropeptide Y receptor type 2 n=1 Tax=Boleophthalmus pectinirostris TaxID=150288 RepID=UPI00243163FD|nr:neuropeptide Y receptor type 2 [Boleophthalmus pectinirostris]